MIAWASSDFPEPLSPTIVTGRPRSKSSAGDIDQGGAGVAD